MTPQKRKAKKKMPVFESIRKPTAPPTRRIGEEHPEELRLPSRRKAKHKSKPESED
ncbi:MAG: hypothetical protein KF736_13085 [Acidobacteria bacterium]|nr:hypothetical protein [Acidobacteriota bacterium]